ncbi:hypothetical protein CANCADRAFT_16218, partial [Tortispora caseinolytica NRRL Y-17796]
MAFGSPGNNISSKPKPPDRGSFLLDHYGDCAEIAQKYLSCIKMTQGLNSDGCREIAKKYLKCRMDNDLMKKDDWKNLGL